MQAEGGPQGWLGRGRPRQWGGTQNKYTEGGRVGGSMPAAGLLAGEAGLAFSGLAGGAHVLKLGNQFLFHDPCPGPEGCYPGALPPSIKDPL